MSEFQNVLEWARYYHARGLSIIPLRGRDKIPAIASWKEYQSRLPTEEEITEWFGNGHNHNIGIVTGQKSDLAVIDLDSPQAVQFSKENGFARTPLVKTAKGFHAYYLFQEGVRNFQKRDDLPGIDLRAEGGYVVAPPSIHPTGKKYEWVEGYRLEDLPLAILPESVLVRDASEKKPVLDLAEGVQEGKRNDSLARLTGRWAGKDLSIDECLTLASKWNESNSPPLSEQEVERTVKSIFEKHQREKRTGCQDGRILIDPGQILVKGEDLMNLEISVEWAIDRLLPQGSITLLYGRGGIGKTYLALFLANAISKGLPCFDLKTIKLKVGYVDYENPHAVLIERVRRINAGDVMFWPCNAEHRIPKLDEEGWDVLKNLPVDVLFIDTLRAGQHGDENSSKDINLVMSRLKEIRDSGKTIVLLHHTPKNNERKYKGSTAILDLADHVLCLNKVDKRNHDVERDDEEDEDCILRFGVKEKTRFEPYHLFIERDEGTIFRIAEDPDLETLEAMQGVLGDRKLFQQQFYTECKDQGIVTGKGKFQGLLRKGEDTYWKAEKEGKRLNYFRVRSNCPAIHSPDTWTEPGPSENGRAEEGLEGEYRMRMPEDDTLDEVLPR